MWVVSELCLYDVPRFLEGLSMLSRGEPHARVKAPMEREAEVSLRPFEPDRVIVSDGKCGVEAREIESAPIPGAHDGVCVDEQHMAVVAFEQVQFYAEGIFFFRFGEELDR